MLRCNAGIYNPAGGGVHRTPLELKTHAALGEAWSTLLSTDTKAAGVPLVEHGSTLFLLPESQVRVRSTEEEAHAGVV